MKLLSIFIILLLFAACYSVPPKKEGINIRLDSPEEQGWNGRPTEKERGISTSNATVQLFLSADAPVAYAIITSAALVQTQSKKLRKITSHGEIDRDKTITIKIPAGLPVMIRAHHIGDGNSRYQFRKIITLKKNQTKKIMISLTQEKN